MEQVPDAATHDGAAALKMRLSNRVDLVMTEGAGHPPLPEQPREMARKLLRCLPRRSVGG